MYGTSNQSYGSFSRDSQEKNKQPSKENKRYNEISKLNHYQTPFQENYNGDYYSKHDYNTDRNQIVFNDLQRNYKQPEFIGSKHYKEDTSYLNSHPILDTESLGLPNVGNTCYM